MSQKVEPNPYPPMSETVNFFGKFLLSASFLLAFLFVLTNTIFVDGYYAQMSAYLPEALIYYLITIVVVAIVTYVSPMVLKSTTKDKETLLFDVYTYFGFLAFLFLSVLQFVFQVPNYPVLKDPFALLGFAWQAVLIWWLASFALGTWAIILFIMKKVTKRNK